MRILIATGLYPPEIGGPATHTVLLESELTARGHVVSVFPFRESRHLPKILRHVHYCYRLWRLCRKTDVVLAQDVLSVGLPALLAAKLSRTPLVVRVPGDYAWEQSTQRFGVTDSIDTFQAKRYGFIVQALRWLQTRVVCGANFVVTPSDYFKRLVIGWGVPPDRIETIYNGVTFIDIPELRERPAGKIIVSAGRLVPWKGFATLIKIMPQLTGWQLVILGDGPERASLEALVNEVGVLNRVRFLDSIPRSEVLAWCAAADAFVLNTHFESFSFQTVEAMYSGTPVIVTNVGSLPELITNDQEGVLIKPDDAIAFSAAIRSIETNPNYWEMVTRRAKTKALQFSVTATVDGFEKLFARITESV